MFHGACDKGCKSPLENDDTVNEQYPSMLLKRAVGEMAKLPGIGQRTALRLVLSLLRQKPEVALALADSLTRLATEVHYCRECHNISDNDICDICANPARDRSLLCVVENIRGVMSIESTGMYKGLYHVLGGVISPMDGIGPGQLEMDSLVERVGRGEVKEVIIALNPTMEGDTTAFYIQRRLSNTPVLLTTLARGVNVGDDIEYTDEVTLGRSLTARIELKK